jgi:hypothetical protein
VALLKRRTIDARSRLPRAFATANLRSLEAALMLPLLRTGISVTVLLAIAFATVTASRFVAQTALSQLGLTEGAARNFVLNEIKGPAGDRRRDIVLTGTRAFLKLPAPARGAAATGLFAWAKMYVNSAAFKASYDSYREGRLPRGRQYPLSVDETLKKEIAEKLAAIEETKKNLAASGLPAADQAKILAAWNESLKLLTSPDQLAARRKVLEAERVQESENDANLSERVEQQTPADPQKLFARRLREFLDNTADVNFAARTISLTDGADGIEFLDRADRQRPWMWQAAVIVGPEATKAARAAAEAWLKEIER